MLKKLLAFVLALALFPSLAFAQRAAQVDILLNGVRDNSGNPLAAGKVFTYTAGTVNDKTCWTAYDKSTSAANPVILDAYGRAQIYCEGSYKFLITDSADTTVQTLDNLFFGLSDTTKWWAGSSGGTANALTATVSPAFPANVDGTEVSLYATNSNTTTTPTLAVSGLTARTIVRPDGSALVAGDIKSGTQYTFRYYSSTPAWVLLNPSLYVGGTFAGGTAGGTGTALTVTTVPTFVALVHGTRITFETSAVNTGAATINVNSLGAIDLNRPDDTALSSNDLASGYTYTALYDSGTNAWLVLTPTFTTSTYTPTLTNTTNVAASTAGPCMYSRIWNTVSVWCVGFNVDPTAAAPTVTELGVSLPIASNLAGNDLSGLISGAISTTERSGIIGADSTNDRANAQWATGDSSNHTMGMNFTYIIK